ncbi:PadR family transcriptional regulator [Companilactobacillus crustorum]|uniref:Transcription regulator n=4 Tax=Companilactobacillus TaxID=2767879 RepID=A0A837RI82_9LACO|nr:PadR family transcriptional regulator [Companilactobacillus crustorum]APU70556.1 hypothetical protein BI355_0199 [Companilactobacillus crustorum]KRK43384.1 transcription regulator [Companilactobacillus crustorum JCM 15951]WDT65286.1 PadR family transcriptional regulator [Companilactobacillus crustorum]GEO76551.1 PadR family transcriptional regulator [Companilactobacillus crustorum]
MYELFILGQLMDHPMTGYALRKAFINIMGDDQAISFGTLYPLLDKLESGNFLALSFKNTENKRPQKLATITEKGTQQFFKLLAEPVTINKQSQLTFLMKIHFLHLLDSQQQVKILKDFQEFSQQKLTRLEELREDLKDNPRMIQVDIDDGLLVKQLQILRAQAQYDWVTKLLQERKGE